VISDVGYSWARQYWYLQALARQRSVHNKVHTANKSPRHDEAQRVDLCEDHAQLQARWSHFWTSTVVACLWVSSKSLQYSYHYTVHRSRGDVTSGGELARKADFYCPACIRSIHALTGEAMGFYNGAFIRVKWSPVHGNLGLFPLFLNMTFKYVDFSNPFWLLSLCCVLFYIFTVLLFHWQCCSLILYILFCCLHCDCLGLAAIKWFLTAFETLNLLTYLLIILNLKLAVADDYIGLSVGLGLFGRGCTN